MKAPQNFTVHFYVSKRLIHPLKFTYREKKFVTIFFSKQACLCTIANTFLSSNYNILYTNEIFLIRIAYNIFYRSYVRMSSLVFLSERYICLHILVFKKWRASVAFETTSARLFARLNTLKRKYLFCIRFLKFEPKQ